MGLVKNPIRPDKFMSFIQTPDSDALGRYVVDSLSLKIACYLKRDPMGIIRYQIDHRGRYPILSKVALLFLATPASSADSERQISVVNKLFTADPSCAGDDIIAHMTFFKPVFANFTFEDFTESRRYRIKACSALNFLTSYVTYISL